MLNKVLFGKILRASTSSAAASGINVITTIIIVRWFGAEIYTDYIIDLAIVSLVLVFLEIVPSNFVIFKIQDNPDWIKSAALQSIVAVFVIPVIIILLENFVAPHNSYSHWIAGYASLMAVKRFFDVWLQSIGKVNQFFEIEALVAFVRLLIIFACVQQNAISSSSVWMSLASATAFAQIIWLVKHPGDILLLYSGLSKESFRLILSARSDYSKYYFGIGLKRFRDNLMPLLAERFFQSKDELAVFFIAYRGLIFANGQVRILENILNHKPTMKILLQRSGLTSIVMAGSGQVLAIVSSYFLLYSSGAGQINMSALIIISMIVWPYTYTILARARAYSEYKINRVNISMLAYVVVLIAVSGSLYYGKHSSAILFGSSLLSAECAGLLAFYACTVQRNR